MSPFWGGSEEPGSSSTVKKREDIHLAVALCIALFFLPFIQFSQCPYYNYPYFANVESEAQYDVVLVSDKVRAEFKAVVTPNPFSFHCVT